MPIALIVVSKHNYTFTQ